MLFSTHRFTSRGLASLYIAAYTKTPPYNVRPSHQRRRSGHHIQIPIIHEPPRRPKVRSRPHLPLEGVSQLTYRTIFFWAPLAKWGLVAAGVKDLSRPAEKLSVSQNVALAATGFIWVRGLRFPSG